MKKRILSLFLCALVLFPLFSPPLTVSASTPSFARVSNQNVFFYEQKEEDSGLFLLPYTYYVEVLSQEGEYTFVRYSSNDPPYLALYGYCKSEQITPVDFTPSRPFLYYPLSIEYRLDGYKESFHGDFSSLSITYGYYGDFLVGSSVYCFVCDGEKTGYIPKTFAVDYERNDDYIPESATEKENVAPFPTAQIILAVLLCSLLLSLAAYLLFRKLSPKKEDTEDPFPSF